MAIYLQDTDFTLYQGDATEQLANLPDDSVHCCVTSPPYWGLRDYGTPGQIGLEQTPDEYVARMVDVFRQVRRVLRDDGTLWLNLGDSYVGAPVGSFNGGGFTDGANRAFTGHKTSGTLDKTKATGLKPKDMVGIPWRVAFALQADGWWLRSDIIWAKPNPMPESVTDRPTKAHEYVFLLTKASRYYFDQEAVREPSVTGDPRRPYTSVGAKQMDGRAEWRSGERRNGDDFTARNVRSVWEIATQPYADAHFATFPQELPRRCIAAGTSERGCCPECGAPWERRIERGELVGKDRGGNYKGREDAVDASMQNRMASAVPFRPGMSYENKTVGWQPTCDHGHSPAPCTVLDPFMGSGTTAYVARNLGRRSIGVELNPDYCALAARRMQQLSLLATP